MATLPQYHGAHPSPPVFDGWIPTREVCAILGISRAAVNQHVLDGHFTTVVGPCCGHLLYRREEIERYRDRNARRIIRNTPLCVDDVTLKEVIGVLGLKYSAVWNHIQKGRIPMHQHGTRYAIHEPEFAAWRETQQLPRRRRNGVHG